MSRRGINKVILIGYLGKNPETRYMPNGVAVTNVSLATTESWKDKQTGEIKEKTEWHRVVFFGKLAEIVKEYLSKGSHIYVEGSLQTRKWKNQSGQDRFITEIIVNGINSTMQILNKPIENNIRKKEDKQNNSKNIKKELFNNKEENSEEIHSINDHINDFEDDIPF